MYERFAYSFNIDPIVAVNTWSLGSLVLIHTQRYKKIAAVVCTLDTGGIQFKVLTTLPLTNRPFFLNLRVSRTKIENLKRQIGRDIKHVTFIIFVTLLVQDIRSLQKL